MMPCDVGRTALCLCVETNVITSIDSGLECNSPTSVDIVYYRASSWVSANLTSLKMSY